MKVQILLFSVFCLGSCNQTPSPQRRRHVPPVSYNGTSMAHSVNGLLERVYDRVSALSTLDEQQLKKLEALEYRLTRMEVTNQERLDNLREELKEMVRRTQNTDWLASKTDGTLDQLRNEFEALRHSIESGGIGRHVDVPRSSPDLECSEKLTAIATLLTSTRAGVRKLEREFDVIGLNLTQLIMAIQDIHQRQNSFPSKQFLNSALHTLRAQPVYAFMQGPPDTRYGAPPPLPLSCAQAHGVQKIQVDSVKGPFFVMCDGETEGGGWTVIQNRKDGSVNFNRNWLEYKHGFGNIAGEFFIGLDKLNDITSQVLHELIIVLEDFDGEQKYARYNAFAIGGEKEDYALNLLGDYQGNAGDSFSYSASYKFSTFDNDNDGWVEGNCAQAHTGAWWYNACEMANLNGQYFGGDVSDAQQFQGMYWNEFHGTKYALKSVKMMIRPVDRLITPDLN